MKILITSGGTKVPIDRVRSITNMSQGTFGSRIADAFFDEVLGGENVVISSVDDLHRKIVDIVRKHAGGTGGMRNLQVIGW